MPMERALRVAVIGAGHWGPNLIRNLDQNDNCQVAMVVETRRERREAVQSRFPKLQVTDSVDVVFSDRSIDAVVVATPTSSHFDLARRALQMDKHVLVEKPMTRTHIEGKELCQLADERRLVLMVGHIFLFNSAVRYVKRLLKEGELGRVHYIAAVRTNLGPIRPDVNAAYDLATHDISIANYWLDTEPLSATAVGGAWINEGIEDAVFATLRYPGEVLVNLHASWLNPQKERTITVVGSERMLTFSDMDLQEPIRIYDKRVTEETTPATFADTFAAFRASIREGDVLIPRVPLDEPLKAECDHFVACVTGGERPRTDGRSGVAVVRVLESIERSMDARGAQIEVAGT